MDQAEGALGNGEAKDELRSWALGAYQGVYHREDMFFRKPPLTPLFQRGGFLPFVNGGKEGFDLRVYTILDRLVRGEDMVMRKQEDKDILKATEDDLWSRIKALAEKEDISYLEATERCVKEYWKDYGLTKES